MSDIRETVFATVAEIMEVDAVDETTAAATVPNWDSLRQLSLIMALEEELEVEFPEDELPHLNSVQRILAVLER